MSSHAGLESHAGLDSHIHTHSDLDMTSAIPPPSGQYLNLVDPPSIDTTIIACTALLLVLPTPLVLVRLYTRIRIKPKLWYDDGTCVLGWGFMVALGVWNIKLLSYGSGSNLWNVSKHDWIHMKAVRSSTLPLTHFNTVLIIARVGLTLTKISFLLLYQRLFITRGNRFSPIYWSIWITFWCNCLFAVAYVITLTTRCVGKAAVVAEGGQCIDEYAILITSSFINVAMDVFVLVIPIIAIWRLQMPTATKRRLSVVFVLGGVAVLASVARLGYQFAVAKDPNQSIAFTINCLLKLIEQSIGVMVSCLPILPAFCQRLRGTGSTSRSKSMGKSKSEEASASILGKQHRGRGWPSMASTKKSKPRDPFPVERTVDDSMTRDEYEELAELERRTPETTETASNWRGEQFGLPEVLEEDGRGPGPIVPRRHAGIVKGTEVDITFEAR
ncbi:MAG: hypothetical protein Q9180_001495 [Flavoplaca navasiana]